MQNYIYRVVIMVCLHFTVINQTTNKSVVGVCLDADWMALGENKNQKLISSRGICG